LSRRGSRVRVPSTPPLLKKPESNDSGFFSSVENDNYNVVVQSVNFLLRSFVAYHAEMRADVLYGIRNLSLTIQVFFRL
ncbi:hypothetical protein, partial [Photobacterium kishitanii]|uniref:hypothetical protein n=1 Tax=Photobacterium kishitanii TaxID=318456 RepID=UPI001B800EDA